MGRSDHRLRDSIAVRWGRCGFATGEPPTSSHRLAPGEPPTIPS
ncbi:MAG: hypothetical protein ACYTBZ_29760 [Planctomycetota bacterium]